MNRARLLLSFCLLASPAAAAPDGLFDAGTSEAPQVAGSPPPAPAPAPRDRRSWVTVRAEGSAGRSRVADAGVSIEEVLPGRVSGVAGPKAIERLKALGVPYEATPLMERFRPEDFPTKDSAFHNYAELTAELKALASKHPGAVSLFSIGKSGKGLDLWALRLNTTEKGTEKSAKPAIAFLGTHHAREHLSTEVPLLLARRLLETRDKPETAKLLESRDIYIIPMVNPDGVEFDIRDDRYHMHRKNLRDNGDGSLGVDLNRNYGFHWGEGGASTDPDSDIYRGPSAFSEPETQAVRAFVEGKKDTLKILLSYHTFSELILYPWGHSDDPIPDGKALSAYKAMASAMGEMTGYKPQQSSRLYIASGDTTDWAWGVHGIYSFTFELTPKSMWQGGFYPGASAIATTFENNWRPALYLIGLADDPARAGDPATAARAASSLSGGR